jgi:CRISPR-associated protein Cas5 subtype I-A
MVEDLNNLFVVIAKINYMYLSVMPKDVMVSLNPSPVPAPSTLWGALGYPYLKNLFDINEAFDTDDIIKKLNDAGLLYASFWSPLYFTSSNLERNYTLTYQKESRSKLISTEYINKCKDILNLVYHYGESYIDECLIKNINDEECLKIKKMKEKDEDKFEECYGKVKITSKNNKKVVEKSDSVFNAIKISYDVVPRGITFYSDDTWLLYIVKDKNQGKSLIPYIYGISRIGRKEDIVSINQVKVIELKKLIKNSEKKLIKTRFYFPCKLSENIPPDNSTRWNMKSIKITKQGTEINYEDFCIPISYIDRKYLILGIANNDALLLDLNLDNKEEIVPIPKEVIDYE